MGVDGGGSTVRAVVVTPDLAVLGHGQGASANPNVVGKAAAGQAIQATMRQALAAADVAADRVAAVGIGVAGAASRHYHPWLAGVVQASLPRAQVVLSTDYEIALVGAMGRPAGVLILAGTGSLAYGISPLGETALVGGWGYLLGDEGGGYWLGRQALRAAIHAVEGRGPHTSLTAALFERLGITEARDLIPCLYAGQVNPARAVAALAPLVLVGAADGDAVALDIVKQAVEALILMAATVTRRLNVTIPPAALAGGLLTTPNPLSDRLCRRLGLDGIPAPRYPPDCGAALLAITRTNPAQSDP